MLGNLEFVFLCRNKMILIWDRLYSESVTCASRFGSDEWVCGHQWLHQMLSWCDFELLPRCIIVSLEEGYSTVPQALLLYSFVFVCARQMSNFCENTTSVVFPFVLATDKVLLDEQQNKPELVSLDFCDMLALQGWRRKGRGEVKLIILRCQTTMERSGCYSPDFSKAMY